MSLRALQGPTGGGAPVGGSGTTNTIPRWTGASTLGDSLLSQSGAFINAANNALVIDTGNVRTGVGAAPDRTFTVYAASGPILNIKTGTAGAMQGMLGISEVDAAVFFGAYSNHPLILRTNNTEQVRVTSTGNVGIGTASPNAILSVYNAGTPTISLWNSSNYSRLATNTNDLYIDAGLGGAAGAVIFRRGSGTVDSARIDSAGNLLMAGNGTAANPIIANTTGVSGMYFPSAATVAIAANGAIAATFSKVAGAGVALGGTTGLVFDASGSQQGIKLRATPDSTDTQTLDCYQENTWTATDGSGAGLTFTVNNTAVYTRVGRLVHARIDITFPSTANGSNALVLLPFNAIAYGGTAFVYASGVGSVMMLANSTGIEFYTAAGVRMTNGALSTLRIIGSIVYQAA